MTGIPCYTKVADYAAETGQDISEADLREYQERFNRVLQHNPYMTKAQAFQAIGRIIETDEVMMAENRAAAKVKEVKVREDAVAMARDIRHGSDVVDNLHALVTGSSARVVKGGNRGINVVRKGIIARYMNEIMYTVDKHVGVLLRGEIDREIIHAMDGVVEIDGRPISHVALEVAKAYQVVMAKMFDQKKLVTPYLERIPDYFLRQTHSMERVAAVDFHEWHADIEASFGDKSFPGLSDEKRFTRLGAINTAIINDHGSSSYNDNPGNKSYSMTRERVLIPNDAEAFFKYFTKYGKGTVFEIMQQTIYKTARDIAVMERLGAEPEKMLSRVAEIALRDANEATLKKYENRKPRLMAELRTAMGHSGAPAKNIYGRATQNILAYEAASKLSGVYLSLIDDVGRAMNIIDHTTGSNPVNDIGQLTYHYMNGLISKEYAKEASRYVSIWVDSLNGHTLNEMGVDQNAPGVMGAITKTMSKVSLMEAHHRGAAPATAIVVSTIAADNAHLPYEKLNKFMQHHMLERYGFDRYDWDIIRQGIEDVSKINAKSSLGKLLTVEGIAAVPDSEYRKMMATRDGPADVPPTDTQIAVQIAVERARLENGWGAAMNDIAEAGTSTAGTTEFARLHGGMDINNPIGAALKLFFLFKSASLKNLNTSKRLFYSGADPKSGNWSGMAKILAYGVPLYFMKQWATDVINHNTPSDPSNIKRHVIPSLAAAIGTSPVADAFLYVFRNDYNKILSKGQQALAASGPVGADTADFEDFISEVASLAEDKSKVKMDDVYAKMARLAITNSPVGGLLKLPYVKAVGGGYILDELKAMGNKRYERNEEKKREESGGFLNRHGLWWDQEHYTLDRHY